MLSSEQLSFLASIVILHYAIAAPIAYHTASVKHVWFCISFAGDSDVRSNGLPFSRAAPRDRENVVADCIAQTGIDLIDAKRRRLEWRAGPPNGAQYLVATLTSISISRPGSYVTHSTYLYHVYLIGHSDK
jgi:hypothetical protein